MTRVLLITTSALTAAEARRLGYDAMMPGRPLVRAIDPSGVILDGGGPVIVEDDGTAHDDDGPLVVVDVSGAPVEGDLPATQRGQALSAIAALLGRTPAWRPFWRVPTGAKAGDWVRDEDSGWILVRRKIAIGGDRPGKLHRAVAASPAGWRQAVEMIDDLDRDELEALVAE